MADLCTLMIVVSDNSATNMLIDLCGGVAAVVPGGKRIARRRYLVLPPLGACLLVFVAGASALAGGSTYYAGKNSQGQKLLFTVDHTASGPKFDPIFINQTSDGSVHYSITH